MVIDVIRALGRRWYVLVAGLLVTAAMVFGAYSVSPPEYNARALVLLLPPKADVGKGGNPFLYLSGLEQPAGILAAYFSSAPARAEVEALSPTAQYEVGIDDSTRGPVLAIDVTDSTDTGTMKTLDYLLARIPAELARLQQDVDARGSAVVGSMPLTVDQMPKIDIHGTLRAMIAALVVGLVATGVAAFSLDGYLQRRQLNKRPSRAAPEEDIDETAWDQSEPKKSEEGRSEPPDRKWTVASDLKTHAARDRIRLAVPDQSDLGTEGSKVTPIPSARRVRQDA